MYAYAIHDSRTDRTRRSRVYPFNGVIGRSIVASQRDAPSASNRRDANGRKNDVTRDATVRNVCARYAGAVQTPQIKRQPGQASRVTLSSRAGKQRPDLRFITLGRRPSTSHWLCCQIGNDTIDALRRDAPLRSTYHRAMYIREKKRKEQRKSRVKPRKRDWRENYAAETSGQTEIAYARTRIPAQNRESKAAACRGEVNTSA